MNEYSWFDVVGAHAKVVVLALVVVGVFYGGRELTRHATSIRLHCEDEWATRVGEAQLQLSHVCSVKDYAQSRACVAARATLDENKDHAIQTCEIQDYRHHLGLDDPWFAVWLAGEVRSYSVLFLGFLLIALVLLLRCGSAPVKRAVRVTRDFQVQRSAELPVLASSEATLRERYPPAKAAATGSQGLTYPWEKKGEEVPRDAWTL